MWRKDVAEAVPALLRSFVPNDSPSFYDTGVFSMGHSMAGLIFAALLMSSASAKSLPPIPVPPPPGKARAFDPSTLSDKDRCTLMSGAAARANAKMPVTAGNIEARHISINCAKRTYETTYAVASAIAAVPPGWQESIEQGMSRAVCSGPLTGPMARRGWHFTSVYSFTGGERIAIEAKCRT